MSKASPLQWQSLPLTPGYYSGWCLHGIPVLPGDVVEYEPNPGRWQSVERNFATSDENGKIAFADPKTDSRFLLPRETAFRWPPKEAARLIRAFEKEHLPKQRRTG